jgi:OHCU decarboxylase
MAEQRLTIDRINALDQSQFTAALGFAFEQSPWIAAQTWPARPFADLAQLHAALCAVMHGASSEQQIALIRAHPDLAGKAAIAGTLTAESTREQASAGLNQLTPTEFAAFTRLNQAYRERFGFPFVICVREQTKTSILESFRTRLQHAPEQEIATALDEIGKIAWLRLRDAVAEDEPDQR